MSIVLPPVGRFERGFRGLSTVYPLRSGEAPCWGFLTEVGNRCFGREGKMFFLGLVLLVYGDRKHLLAEVASIAFV